MPGNRSPTLRVDRPTRAGRSRARSVDQLAGSAISRGQRARRLHDGDPARAAERVAPVERDDEVQALVEDPRERVRGIEADRREHGQHLPREVLARSSGDARRPVAALRKVGSLRVELGQQDLVQHAVLLLDERVGATRTRCSVSCGESPSAVAGSDPEGAASGPPRGSRRTRRGSCCRSSGTARARGAAAGVLGELEDPPLELEERELPVQVQRGVAEVGACFDMGPTRTGLMYIGRRGFWACAAASSFGERRPLLVVRLDGVRCQPWACGRCHVPSSISGWPAIVE